MPLKYVICRKEICSLLISRLVDFFMKLLRTSDMSVVAGCQSMFHVDLPGVVIQRRLEKFECNTDH